jgi:hypothetical protein
VPRCSTLAFELMTHVYLLYHLHRVPSGDEQVLFLGAYGSRPSALRAIKRIRKLPGFNKYPKLREHGADHGPGFNINRIRLGANNWADGFTDEVHAGGRAPNCLAKADAGDRQLRVRKRHLALHSADRQLSGIPCCADARHSSNICQGDTHPRYR